MLRILLYHVQGVAVIVAGCATLGWSSDLMSLLIHIVGEEYALGRDNVVHLENGGKLLTNPAAMVQWTIPFWILGCIQMSGGLTLLLNYYRRRAEAHDAPK